MSPLWRDRVSIYLAPSRLALVRRSRGPRARVVAACELEVPAGAVGDLGPVLGRLAEALADPAWHGALARVVVADHRWARYVVVPWQETRLDAEGHLSRARFLLADAYGAAVADWAVTLADTPPGRPGVACAMPATLRGSLEEVLAPARLELVSLQPRLVVAFNAWRHRLPADNTWFVSLDEGLMSAVHLGGGAWDRIHLALSSRDWRVELERLQAFGKLVRTGGDGGRMLVDAPEWMRRTGIASPTVEWLEESDPRAPAHELALLQRRTA